MGDPLVASVMGGYITLLAVAVGSGLFRSWLTKANPLERLFGPAGLAAFCGWLLLTAAFGAAEREVHGSTADLAFLPLGVLGLAFLILCSSFSADRARARLALTGLWIAALVYTPILWFFLTRASGK